MKRNRLLIGIMGTIFFASLFIILFSVVQIVNADNKVDEALEEWDNLKQTLSTEDELELDLLVQPEQIEKRFMEEVEAKKDKLTIEKGDVFGKVIIPLLDRELPLIHGTDSDELARGVGHYIGTAMPGEKDNSVIAGHRDTVFRDLGELGIGDQVIIETAEGTFTYEITGGRIVESDDRTVIVPHEDAILTLITCYPFNFVGNAPQRYILYAGLVEDKQK